MVRRWLGWAALAALAVYGAVALFITLYGLQDDVQPSDVGIVLGTKVEDDGTASPGMASRLDRGAELYRQHKVAHLIVSGGVNNDGVVEAQVMRDYLVAHDVASSAIVMEGKSKNTWQNAKFSLDIMRAQHWHSAIVVSEFFHIYRAHWFFKEQGLAHPFHAYSARWNHRFIPHMLRETTAVIYYTLLGR